MRVLGLVALLVLTSVNAQAQGRPVDRAGWLAGCWEQRAGTRVTVEMWMAPFGGTMLGASRTVSNGATVEHEFLRLAARGDTLVYIAMPSGQALTEFRATTVSDTLVRFENRAHDFPQVILYRRTAPDSIVARIEGPGPNNTTRGASFPMRRISCTEVPAPTPPPDTLLIGMNVSPDGGRFVVVKGASNNWDLFVTNAEAGDARRLTDHSAVDYQPDWSPDGSRIAFVSSREGHQEIYTIAPGGSALRRLTSGAAHNSEPAWSPDGRTRAFRSEREGRPQVWLMSADGTEQRRVTQDTELMRLPFSR